MSYNEKVYRRSFVSNEVLDLQRRVRELELRMSGLVNLDPSEGESFSDES